MYYLQVVMHLASYCSKLCAIYWSSSQSSFGINLFSVAVFQLDLLEEIGIKLWPVAVSIVESVTFASCMMVCICSIVIEVILILVSAVQFVEVSLRVLFSNYFMVVTCLQHFRVIQSRVEYRIVDIRRGDQLGLTNCIFFVPEIPKTVRQWLY